MQFSVLQNDSAFDALDSSWRALIPQSYADTPFQTPEFLKNWWSTRGGGEWADPALWLGTARDGTGDVHGVAPLFRRQDDQGVPNYMFLGSVEIADYLDFIVREADAPDFLDQVLDQLKTQEPGELFWIWLICGRNHQVLTSSLLLQKSVDGSGR